MSTFKQRYNISYKPHFKASALWADAFYKSKCPSVCGLHIVPCGKFHRIGGAPPETFPSEKYLAPEEVSSNRKSFDSPISK